MCNTFFSLPRTHIKSSCQLCRSLVCSSEEPPNPKLGKQHKSIVCLKQQLRKSDQITGKLPLHPPTRAFSKKTPKTICPRWLPKPIPPKVGSVLHQNHPAQLETENTGKSPSNWEPLNLQLRTQQKSIIVCPTKILQNREKIIVSFSQNIFTRMSTNPYNYFLEKEANLC